jgi:hypothetical protein
VAFYNAHIFSGTDPCIKKKNDILMLQCGGDQKH